MATSASRAHLFSQLNRSKGRSSPTEDEYATASSFDAARDAIHSTAQMDINTEQLLPGYGHQAHDTANRPPRDNVSEAGSEGSTEMSIELGRGVKRGARERDVHSSPSFVINMGNGSMYELTGTPPLDAQDEQRKKNDGLRRQASLRAAQNAKSHVVPNPSVNMKQRSLSAALKQIGAEDEDSLMVENSTQNSATLNARNTRFMRSRQTSTKGPPAATRVTSAPAQQSRQAGANSTTAQSNSFLLPEMPNIHDIVAGARKDGTPIVNRNVKAQSRFTSGAHRPSRQEYDPVDRVPAAPEEKAIYDSIKFLSNRVAELELEKSERESDINDLRSQLTAIQRGQDSALGSDDDATAGAARAKDDQRIQFSINDLQERIRAERQTSNSDIRMSRVKKERDDLLKQLAATIHESEEVKAEYEAFRESHAGLQHENQELKDEIDSLRKDNQGLHVLMEQMRASYEQDTLQRQKRETKRHTQAKAQSGGSKPVRGTSSRATEVENPSQRMADHEVTTTKERRSRPKSTGNLDDMVSDELAAKIAREVRKHRQAAAATVSQQQPAKAGPSSYAGFRQKASNTDLRPSSANHAASAPVEEHTGDAGSTMELDFSLPARKRSAQPAQPYAYTPRQSQPQHREEDGRDLTLLSWQDPQELMNLRKKLEEERKSGKLASYQSNGRTESEVTQTTDRGFKQFQQDLKSGKLRADCAAEIDQQNSGLPPSVQTLPRKSSMRDVNSGADDGTGCLNVNGTNVVKNVRVQSPHTSNDAIMTDRQTNHQQTEHGDTSVLSNISRRRRRAVSADAMTSDFILPDITIGRGHGDATSRNSGNIDQEDTAVSALVPVTDREVDPDLTSATMRPAQEPAVALATVVKQLEREIKALKIKLASQQRLYNQHDPALSKRKRIEVKVLMDTYTNEIEKRSNQVYALYDVLEGQKRAAQAAQASNEQANQMNEQELEETLSSIGIDPVELSGRIGRGTAQPFGLDGMNDISEDELPWDGLSDVGSE